MECFVLVDFFVGKCWVMIFLLLCCGSEFCFVKVGFVFGLFCFDDYEMEYVVFVKFWFGIDDY